MKAKKNKKGIPTAACQVLQRWVSPCRGTPPQLGTPLSGYFHQGTPVRVSPHHGSGVPGVPHWVPLLEYPHPGLGVYPGYPPLGYPCPGSGVPPLGYLSIGVPLSWLGGYPGYPLSGYPPCRGTPLGVDRQKDRHESKHNLPVILRTRSVIRETIKKDQSMSDKHQRKFSLSLS